MFQRNMNLDVNPCEDFYEYVCGNFDREHPRNGLKQNDWYTEKDSSIQRNVAIKLENLAKQSGGTHFFKKPKAVQNVAKLYKSCINIANSKYSSEVTFTNSLNELLQMTLKITKLPKFPNMLRKSFGESNEESSNFDWINTVVKLKRSAGLDKLVGFKIGMLLFLTYSTRHTMSFYRE